MIVTLVIQNRKKDFKVNELQIVKDTLDILMQAGYVGPQKVIEVLSMRNNVIVDLNKNYIENEIYGGDILVVS